jgi:hypothetical protein
VTIGNGPLPCSPAADTPDTGEDRGATCSPPGHPAAARTDHASASRSIESGGGDNVLAAAGVHGCYRMLVCGTAHVPKVIGGQIKALLEAS